MSFTIRELCPTDDMMPLLEAWKQESKRGEFGIEVDVVTMEKHLKGMRLSGTSNVFVILKDERSVVGVVGVQILNSPIGRDRMGSEHLWYVCKECRGAKSVRLLKAAIRWAEGKGCSHFMATASMLASSFHEQICDLYEAVGMEKFETTFIVRIGR